MATRADVLKWEKKHNQKAVVLDAKIQSVPEVKQPASKPLGAKVFPKGTATTKRVVKKKVKNADTPEMHGKTPISTTTVSVSIPGTTEACEGDSETTTP